MFDLDKIYAGDFKIKQSALDIVKKYIEGKHTELDEVTIRALCIYVTKIIDPVDNDSDPIDDIIEESILEKNDSYHLRAVFSKMI